VPDEVAEEVTLYLKMGTVMRHDVLACEHPEPPEILSPWCPYTADRLKLVLLHMGLAHHQAWLDLVLYPQIAGGDS
jgi:hypothetical protein